jgi:CRISPR-associated endoribonuclease Cas6
VSQELTQISLVFLTPTRVKHNGVYCNGQSITAETLLNALRRKVDLYNTHYLHLDIASPPRPSHIQLKGELKVTPWSRYSSRQKQGIQLDGLLGKVTLEGDLQPWANLLALGEYTHIGKNTSFGLGQFQLERQGL